MTSDNIVSIYKINVPETIIIAIQNVLYSPEVVGIKWRSNSFIFNNYSDLWLRVFN